MSHHLTFVRTYGIEDLYMPAAGEDTKFLINAWKKTTEQELLNTLKADYGFSQALSRSLAHLVQEHIDPTTAIYGAAHKSSIMPPVHMSDLENL